MRKRSEYEGKIAMLSQELERVSGTLSSKQELYLKLTEEF